MAGKALDDIERYREGGRGSVGFAFHLKWEGKLLEGSGLTCDNPMSAF